MHSHKGWFSVFVTPKRTKRRIGFMRRSGNRIGQGIVLLPGTELKRNHARNAPRQKNKRKFIRAKVRKQTSLPEVNRKPPPSYHISYNQALDFYKRIRKGKKFHASRKVIWRNRHRLFVTATIKKNNRYYEGDLYPLKEKEYYVPEPPEQDEDHEWIDTGAQFPSDSIGDGPDSRDQCHVYSGWAGTSSDKQRAGVGSVGKLPETSEEYDNPQWIQTGPEYSSDYSGDGPDSSEEYDPEKDKAGKRKRNKAKTMRRLRTKKRREGGEKRDRTGDNNKRYERRVQRREAGVKRDRSGDVEKQFERRS